MRAAGSTLKIGETWPRWTVQHPTLDRRVIRLQTALGEQFFDIAQRERKNQLRRRLPPLEDCRSGCVLHDLFRLPANTAKLATHPDLSLAGSGKGGRSSSSKSIE
jgi:hypothetical protein